MKYNGTNIKEFEIPTKTMQEIATELFTLLDDIDTAGDLVKGDNKLFREIVEKIISHRFCYALPAGDELIFNTAEGNSKLSVSSDDFTPTDFNEGKDLISVDIGNEFLNRMIARVCRLREGDKIDFSRDDFHGIYSFWHKGVEFTPTDRIIENIIGGAYRLSYSTSHEKPNIVTFKRHALKSDGTAYYISPDKRLAPDVTVNRKPVQ